MAGHTVEVEFTKYDGRRHWHFRMTYLGEDEHGVWLAAPPGTVLQRGDEPPRVEADGFVAVAPREGNWFAAWNVDRDPEVYVDVTSARQWSHERLTMVDLDLDVVRDRDGRVQIVDEDEFDEHQVLFGYPADLVDQARATADDLAAAMAARTEPFGDRGASWLAALAAAGVSPAADRPR